MADEIRVTETLFIRKTDSNDPTVVMVFEDSRPTQFTADLAGSSGPYVGTLIVNQTITVINLNSYQVAPGGIARFHNQDPTNVVFVGLYDQETGSFKSMEELLPGEFHRVRLSRYLGQDTDIITGTGTESINPSYLALKASAAACKVLVKIFPP